MFIDLQLALELPNLILFQLFHGLSFDHLHIELLHFLLVARPFVVCLLQLHTKVLDLLDHLLELPSLSFVESFAINGENFLVFVARFRFITRLCGFFGLPLFPCFLLFRFEAAYNSLHLALDSLGLELFKQVLDFAKKSSLCDFLLDRALTHFAKLFSFLRLITLQSVAAQQQI